MLKLRWPKDLRDKFVFGVIVFYVVAHLIAMVAATGQFIGERHWWRALLCFGLFWLVAGVGWGLLWCEQWIFEHPNEPFNIMVGEFCRLGRGLKWLYKKFRPTPCN